jgi:hypothetical protein
VNNYIDEDDMYNDMPEGWWLKTSPCLYLLAALVHKANPDVISDPTQTRQGCTRITMKNKEAAEIASEKEAEKSRPPTTVRAKAEEEMFTWLAIEYIHCRKLSRDPPRSSNGHIH